MELEVNGEIQKLQEESVAIQKKLQELEEQKSQLITRVVELQGAMKFLQGKQAAKESKEVK